MRRDDLIRIRHILDAAKEVMSFTTNRKRSDLDRNRMLTLAIVKSIDIDLDRVWDTITDDLPSLLVDLEKIVHREETH